MLPMDLRLVGGNIGWNVVTLDGMEDQEKITCYSSFFKSLGKR